MPSEYKPPEYKPSPEYKPPKKELTNLYKPRAYIRDFQYLTKIGKFWAFIALQNKFKFKQLGPYLMVKQNTNCLGRHGM